MVREARSAIEAGEIGTLRLVQVTYIMGSLGTRVEDQTDLPSRLRWRLNPAVAGASHVMGDIGTHAHQLLTFVTGRQADIDQILKAFGVYTSRPQDHLPITIIGSDATGVWTRNYGFLSGPELATVVTRVIDGTAEKGEVGGQ